MSHVTPEDVEKALRANITDITHLKVDDVSDNCPGSKFHIVVVSPSFENKALLERHRAVHDAINPLRSSIHAVTIKAWTEAQYEKEKAKQQ